MAEKKFFVDINLQGSDISNLKADTLDITSNLASANTKRIVYWSGQYYYSNGTSWIALGGSGNLPTGGATGDILAKASGTDYDVEWISNYTSTVQHEVKAGVALTKGQAVYVSSANGANMIVSKASNALESTSSKTMGLVASSAALNNIIFVITEGLLTGTGGAPLDTSTANAGDPVWLGTNGNLIFGLANKPVAPAHLVFLGIVTRSSATVGEIFVKVQNGFELGELHNVDALNALNNDGLFYNTTTSLWEHKSIATVLGYTPENVANKSTSTSLGTSDTLYPTQNAVKVYADNLLGNANALVYKGTIDCSTNPNYPTADAGWMYIASVAGKIGGASGTDVEVGDMIICNTDGTVSGNQATVGQYWNVIQKNIIGAVTGPASSVNNTVAVFDGTTGKVLKEGIITDNGTNVGIGTISPTQKLDVNGNAIINGILELNSSTAAIFSLIGTDHVYQQYYPQGIGSGRFAYTGFGETGSTDFRVFNETATGNISLATNSTNRLFISSSGNVGIGTDSPGYKLDVAGEISIRGGDDTDDARMYFQSSDNSNRFAIETNFDPLIETDLLGFRSILADNILVLKGDGNVGVGTSTPLSTANYINLTIGDNAINKTGLLKLRSTYNNGDGAELYQSPTGTTFFNVTSSLSGYIIDSQGNMGIGGTINTLSPLSAKLHINNIGTGNSFLVEDNTNPDTTPFLIDSDGNVAVGSSSAYSASKLDIYAGNTARVPLSVRRADSAADHMVFVKEDTNTQWWVALTSDDFRLYNSTATDNILFGVNGGSADTGNKVGIGTATPSAKLDVNGDIKISTIANATIDTDKFLVSDSGVIKYRTGAELLSDILTLTTTSTNGPATLTGNTLNIPVYESSLIPKMSGNEIWRGSTFRNNSTTIDTTAGIILSTTGTNTARSVGTTSYATRGIRLGVAATTASVGRYQGMRGAALLWYVTGGFLYTGEFNISDTAFVAGTHNFWGLASSTSDLLIGGVNNDQPSALTNIIAFANDSGDANLQIMYNDASGTATKIDLGVDFPSNRTAGAAITTIYSCYLYNTPASSNVIYRIVNKETGAVAQGTLSTNLPASTVGLNFFGARTMGTPLGGVNNSGQFDVYRLGVYSL